MKEVLFLTFTFISSFCCCVSTQDIYKTLINSVEKGKKLYSDKVHDLLLKNNIINKTSATTITTTTPKDERLPGNVYEIKNPASVNDTAYLVKQQMMAKLTGET